MIAGNLFVLALITKFIEIIEEILQKIKDLLKIIITLVLKGEILETVDQ